jgi:hypothetical protein
LATSIGFRAFDGCTSLVSVSFLPEATSIGNQAFANCTSLTTVSFPAVQTIGEVAFMGCTSLATVSFPAVTSIDGGAFYMGDDVPTSLTSITIAANITFTPDHAGLPNGFITLYNGTANKAAGTYTRSGTDPNYVWTKQP